ncbi:cytochrome c oxidase subunit II [Asticcacaulis sp. AND118]|uniref:cytochrome c oxidase subunit II n=1 Tax=Asticcacaulis sp. AND118 TaxID=2840468 RepID=UPI001D000554|nr:cytochrome c oxidase subunit II [Asticcacaulis sp. AND118]UDF02554.1 cytochrome c oxidase subunit II [Asticcacaulis sp. AND118]
MTALAGALGAGAVWAQDNLGLPTDKAIDLQPAAAPLKHDAIWFHDIILMPVITAIVVLVLALLIWIILRYNKRANPKPATFSHNTAIEIAWTVVPVLILVVIAFFSFSLLRKYNDMPTPDVVVKATGYQWYWAYDYPELGVEGVESRLLPEARELETAHEAKVPFLLGVDNELIVPVNRVVQVQVTGYDVIHAFALPAFGLKTDAIPGRLNSTWFKAEKTGVFYGQCSELCGVDHAYMPIVIRVVTDKEFDDYIVKAGGKTKAMIAAEEAATAAEAQRAAADAAASADASTAASAAAPAEADAAASAAAPAVQ